jgi:hypothetical protein
LSSYRATSIIQKMARIFDTEHTKSIAILNEFSVRVAHAARVPNLFAPGASGSAVREADSHEIDHLQGADLAAGWAVDLLTLTNGDYVSLAKEFAWVSVNGVFVASAP